MTTVWRLLIEEPDVTLPWMRANGRIAIGWGEIGDVSQYSLADIADAIRDRNEEHPDHEGKPEANVQHGSHSLFDFCFTMEPGDLVIVSGDHRRRGVWKVAGPYQYVGPDAAPLNYQHQRKALEMPMNPDALWRLAGGRLRRGINFRTLDRCINDIGD
jgi:predicted Mrr-cat superfamily restriction endonuclease